MISEFSKKVIKIIKDIPSGEILTYGEIAEYAGNKRASRAVAWILHSSTGKYNLPWHRVVNSKGEISVKDIYLKEKQIYLLKLEGVKFLKNGEVDIKKHIHSI